MRKRFILFQIVIVTGTISLFSQQPDRATLEGGVNLIHTKTYSARADPWIRPLSRTGSKAQGAG
ncbi:MAG: hypothetical protein WAL94_05215 [Bacteroidales bacterium]